jgi:DNA repair exonuclease SbcCD nuclease subunit
MGKPVRIVLTGDLHVGRRPSRVADEGLCRRSSCAAGWAEVVELAINERADLVAVSGDLVDRENRFYEAFGPLERGLRRLSEAGIETVAVAGNHDYDVLPKLADQMSATRFRLLGRGGRWERHTVHRDGRPVLHVDGWSFPAEAVLDNPLRGGDVPAAPSDGLPALGLVHGDLDAPASRYAPLSLAELRRTCHRFWLLGHIHKPALHEADGCCSVLYPGSPQGMDPGETGCHGPWLLDVNGQTRLRPRQVATCRVRYEQLNVGVGGASNVDEVRTRVLQALRSNLEPICEQCGPLELVSCRLVLSGRTPLHRQLRRIAADMQGELEIPIGSVTAQIEKIDVEARPAIELQELARGGGPPGALARLLLDLQMGGREPVTAVLVDKLVGALGAVWEARPYLPLNYTGDAERPAEPAPDEAKARRVLIDQGLVLLDELLAQKEGT